MKSKKIIHILFLSVLFCSLCVAQNSENQKSDNSSVTVESTLSQHLDNDNQEDQFKITNSNSTKSEEQFKFSNTQSENVPAKKPSGVWIFIRMILVLAIIIVCIYFVMNFMKKSVNGQSSDDDIYLRKVAHVTLAPGKSVQVVTLLENCYVVGVSDSNVNLLGTIQDKELIAAMNLSADKKSKQKKAKNFSEILEMFMPSKSTKTTFATQDNIYSESAQQVKDFVDAQRRRVNRTKKKE